MTRISVNEYVQIGKDRLTIAYECEKANQQIYRRKIGIRSHKKSSKVITKWQLADDSSN